MEGPAPLLGACAGSDRRTRWLVRAVRAEDVTAVRAGRVVVERLGAELADGATGIVGPAGVGKPMLLRLLDRLADPR
jgi:ABC-type transporter Mla maintaining outer membrane lipid asymmetry ATPase subunit MlaF